MSPAWTDACAKAPLRQAPVTVAGVHVRPGGTRTGTPSMEAGTAASTASAEGVDRDEQSQAGHDREDSQEHARSTVEDD